MIYTQNYPQAFLGNSLTKKHGLTYNVILSFWNSSFLMYPLPNKAPAPLQKRRGLKGFAYIFSKKLHENLDFLMNSSYKYPQLIRILLMEIFSETHISTKSPCSQTSPWFPFSYGNCWWSSRSEKSSFQRTRSSFCLGHGILALKEALRILDSFKAGFLYPKTLPCDAAICASQREYRFPPSFTIWIHRKQKSGKCRSPQSLQATPTRPY